MVKTTYRKSYTKRKPYRGNTRHEAEIKTDGPYTVSELHKFLQGEAESAEASNAHDVTQLDQDPHNGLGGGGASGGNAMLGFNSGMAQSSGSQNVAIGGWDISNTTSMENMFGGCPQFSTGVGTLYGTPCYDRIFHINVVDAASNKPIPDARVMVRPAGGTYDTPVILNTTVNDEGWVNVLAPASDGRVLLRARYSTDKLFYKTFEQEFELDERGLTATAYMMIDHELTDDYEPVRIRDGTTRFNNQNNRHEVYIDNVWTLLTYKGFN